jgi:N-acetylglutamate synthase-like GNAT family acetyltransferase
MIRVITADDLPTVSVEMGTAFFKEGGMPGGFDPEVFRRNWSTLLSAGMGRIWLLEVDGKACGALGVLITNDINDGQRVITEAFWYVVPDMRNSLHGVRLFTEMEKHAADIKAKRILMIHYHATMDYRLPQFYEKFGYRAIETHYAKELTWQ